jgi:hypothetical protein
MSTTIGLVILASVIFQVAFIFFIRRYFKASDAKLDAKREALVHEALSNLDARLEYIIREGGAIYWAERDGGEVKAEIIGFKEPLGDVEQLALVKRLRSRYPKFDIVKRTSSGVSVLAGAKGES